MELSPLTYSLTPPVNYLIPQSVYHGFAPTYQLTRTIVDSNVSQEVHKSFSAFETHVKEG